MMRHFTVELASRGRDIALVILMEQSRISPVAMPVPVRFGELSYLNPYAQMKNPDQLFRLACPGGHGEYSLPEYIGGIALAIHRHLLPHASEDS